MPQPPWHPFRSAEARERYLAEYDRQAARWPVPATTRMVSTSYGRTHVRVSGPEQAAPLLLVPGMGATSMMWSAIVPRLVPARRTLAVDNVNDYGRSVPSRPIRTREDYARWLGELLGGLGLDGPADVLAASYGAFIAAELGLREPRRFRRLSLMSPAAVVASMRPVFLARAMLSALPIRSLTRSFLGVIAAGLERQPGGRALVDAMADDLFLASKSFVRRPPVPPRALRDRDLRRLGETVRLQVIVGADDPVLNVRRAADRLRRLAPTARVDVLPGFGHDLFAVGADEVARCVLEFLV